VGLVRRFRCSTGIARQQYKPIVVPVVVFVALFAAAMVLPQDVGVDPGDVAALAAFDLGFIGLAIAIGISVSRYRLYDIDRIVSRTVAYVAVTAVLVGLYAALVLLIGAALRPLTAHAGDLVVAVSTLAVAAAFQPVRRRVQDVVDRRFDRQRYDGVRAVERFGARLRDRVALRPIVDDVTATVTHTVAPAHATVWLRDREARS
jgi:hypothetical protein